MFTLVDVEKILLLSECPVTPAMKELWASRVLKLNELYSVDSINGIKSMIAAIESVEAQTGLAVTDNKGAKKRVDVLEWYPSTLTSADAFRQRRAELLDRLFKILGLSHCATSGTVSSNSWGTMPL